MSAEMKIPNCVGIIMDGNRRWARGNEMHILKGHQAGGQTLKTIIKDANDLGIKHIIFYTFSTENWKRSDEEVFYLLDLISGFIKKELDYFNKENGVLHYVGDLSCFSEGLQRTLSESVEKTKNNSGINVYFALNYGGRAEILSAVKKIIQQNPNIEDINEDFFAKNLQTYPMPDPDIIIRTSGEMRLSGFLPWQGVYSELFFTKTLWPDFNKEEFLKIIEEYSNRERRIGK